MRVLVTGADGFIGKNLCWTLRERKGYEIRTFTRRNSTTELPSLLKGVDCVFHLAGANRPQNHDGFITDNVDLTKALCDSILCNGGQIKMLLASSIQAERENPYGASKRAAELVVEGAAGGGAFRPFLFRLPNVFGKWCRPNYNSVVATFCHNVARGLPVTVNDPAAPLKLAYVDDVVGNMIAVSEGKKTPGLFVDVEPTYSTTVGEIAEVIHAFRDDRESLRILPVGKGLFRALYSTYVSYLPPSSFSYAVPKHADARGVFVEMLKTENSGQFSFFTAHPGISRGGHYHHTKSEKFLVIKGSALYRFRNIETGETYEIRANGEEPMIVDTAPGWSHDITNVGDDDLIVMLWANEVFDRENPDTFASKL